MGLKEIDENTYILPGSPSTLITKTIDKVIVVDPGKGKERHKDIIRETKKLSINPNVVLATHSHSDHIEVVPKLRLPLYIHEYEFSSAKNKLVRDIITIGSRMFKGYIKEADRLGEIENVKVFRWNENLFGIKTIKLNGHSPGMTGFSVGNIVYAGDSFFGEKLLDKVGTPYFVDYDLFIESLKTLSKFAEKGYTLIPSHGSIVSGNKALEIIEKNIYHAERTLELVMDILSNSKSEDCILKELMKKLDIKITPYSLYLNKISLKAILAKLFNEDKITVTIENDILKFKVS